MLRRHATTVAMLHRDRTVLHLLQDYFDLPRRQALMACLLDRGLGQADLVLALLYLRDRSAVPDRRRLLEFYIHRLVGRPICIAEPMVLQYGLTSVTPRVTFRRPADDRRVTWVLPTNPRQPSTEAHARWSIFRVGRTVAQLRVRGVTRRDIRRAVRRDWVRLEHV